MCREKEGEARSLSQTRQEPIGWRPRLESSEMQPTVGHVETFIFLSFVMDLNI